MGLASAVMDPRDIAPSSIRSGVCFRDCDDSGYCSEDEIFFVTVVMIIIWVRDIAPTLLHYIRRSLALGLG